jgi:multiple sugar transport system ATP-binding protein
VFVAQFIGTPPMNFINATVSANGEALEAAALRLPTPRAWREAVSRHVGGRVVIGIRPEKVGLVDGMPAGTTTSPPPSKWSSCSAAKRSFTDASAKT